MRTTEETSRALLLIQASLAVRHHHDIALQGDAGGGASPDRTRLAGPRLPRLASPVPPVVLEALAPGKRAISPCLGCPRSLDGDSVAIIDLDKFAEANPVWEVAEVLAYLTSAPFNWLPLPYDRAWRAAQAFAEEYFAHVPEVWRDRLPFHYAGAVLQLALLLSRDLVPGWPDKIEALLEEAKNSLEGRIW